MSLPILPDVIRVYVGPKLAAISTKCDTQDCVFAQALEKKTGLKWSVGASTATAIGSHGLFVPSGYYEMADSTCEQVRQFDKNGTVRPGHYRFNKVKR